MPWVNWVNWVNNQRCLWRTSLQFIAHPRRGRRHVICFDRSSCGRWTPRSACDESTDWHSWDLNTRHVQQSWRENRGYHVDSLDLYVKIAVYQTSNAASLYHVDSLWSWDWGSTGSSLESNTIRELPPAFRSGIWNPCCLQISRNYHAAFECDAWSLLSAFGFWMSRCVDICVDILWESLRHETWWKGPCSSWLLWYERCSKPLIGWWLWRNLLPNTEYIGD